MNNPTAEFAQMVFQRSGQNDRSKSDLNIQAFNVLMAFDGQRSVETICREDIYEVAYFAEKVQLLLSQDLIKPVRNGRTLNPNAVQQIVKRICQQQGAGDNVAAMPAAGTKKQSEHRLQPPDKLSEGIIEIKDDSPAANKVFVTMMSHILENLKKTDAKLITGLRAELNTIVSKMQVQDACALFVLQWLKGQVRLIASEVPLKLFREVITQVYTLSCEYYGPDAADRILQDAAKTCDQIPEAREVSPANFL